MTDDPTDPQTLQHVLDTLQHVPCRQVLRQLDEVLNGQAESPSSGNGGVSVAELGYSPSALAPSLERLEDAGFIEWNQAAGRIYPGSDFDFIIGVLHLRDELCQIQPPNNGGDPSHDSLDNHDDQTCPNTNRRNAHETP